MAADSGDVSSLMKSVREEVVMTTYSVAMVAGTILMLGNMSRNLHLGNPLSVPHGLLYGAFLIAFLMRRRIGARWLAPVLLLALFLAGTFGYFIYGFIGNSAPVFMALCIVAASFYGSRGGLIAALASGAVMLAVAGLALTDRMVFSYDLVAFIASPFSWVAALTTFAAMAALALTHAGLMHRHLESLLREQQARMKDLAQTNASLEEQIAARTAAEEELRSLHERFQLALETVGLGIFDWDAATNRLQADARVFEMYGVSPEGRDGQFNDWTDFLHPEDREQTLRQINDARRGDVGDFKLSYRIVRPDGGVGHIEVHNHVVRDASGRPLRLVGADFDVTERKQTEDRLLLAEKVFDNSPVAIVITDSENRVISVNSAFSRITGYGEGEVLGLDPRALASGLHDAGFFERMWRSLEETDAWEGEVWDRRKNGEIYPKWMTISVVRDPTGAKRLHYVSIFSDITERKQAEEHIHHLAHHDPLTTLPNRMELNARLELSIAEADRYQRSVAVMFLDLDRFKTINDSLGHHVGDLLLIEVARRLRQTVRLSDTVARLGGDEFVVILPALEDPGDAATVAMSILEALRRPYLIEGHVLHSTPSIGVSIYPQDGDDASAAMKYADTAMYHAKEMGRNGFQFFSQELNQEAMARLALERGLRNALEQGEFLLHFLPRLDRDGRVTGVEALIRWNRPEHGLQLPAALIPFAEESDLIVLIGDWVLAEVCRQLRKWLDAGLAAPSVAINLSARQLRRTTLPDQIADALIAADLPPHLLEFEVTESMAMDDPEEAALLLRELRVMGTSLAIDDFGTGYSSLSYLKRLPVDYLKIDRSFVAHIVHDPGDLAIVRGAIALAQSLGLTVVAEGVESAEQLALLMSAGCDEFQGFHFSRPLPADELEAFLSRHSADADRP